MTRLSFIAELLQIQAEIARLKRRAAELDSLPRTLPAFPVFRREPQTHHQPATA